MVEPLWVKLRPYREVVLGEPRTNKKSWTLHCGCMTAWASPWPQHLWLTALFMPRLPAIHTRPYPSFWGRGYDSTQATLTIIRALASCFPWSVYIFLETSSRLFTWWCNLTATVLIRLSSLANISFSLFILTHFIGTSVNIVRRIMFPKIVKSTFKVHIMFIPTTVHNVVCTTTRFGHVL